jgi:hypothetical protein
MYATMKSLYSLVKSSFFFVTSISSMEFLKKWMVRSGILSLMTLVMVEAATHSESNDLRQLQQQTLNYRANYSADFQYWRSTNCDGDAPILQVSCFGKGMTVPNTSDTTILCEKLDVPRVTNGTTYECRNTCNETAAVCSDIYLTEEIYADIFGSIRFLCESDDVREVEASLVYLGGINNGTCDASAFTTSPNAHVARLGISCPVGSSRGYVYNDTYFECRGLDTITLDYLTDPDIYVCISGVTCGASQSCNFAFNDLLVRAELPRFLDSSCIETTLSEITPFPTVSPTVPTSASSLDYSARFQASWAVRYDSEASIAVCTSANPSILVACDNESRIQLVNVTDGSMNCTEINIDQLQCTGDLNAIKNQFTSVFYVSKVSLGSILWMIFKSSLIRLPKNNCVVSRGLSLFRTVSDLGYPRHA